MDTAPSRMAGLEDEDAPFIKRFVLASGSLKEMAKVCGVSYPTVRLRLDRLIQKSETAEADLYVALVKRLAADGKPDFDTAKLLQVLLQRIVIPLYTPFRASNAGPRKHISTVFLALVIFDRTDPFQSPPAEQ